MFYVKQREDFKSGDTMKNSSYNAEHKNAQCPAAQGLLSLASQHAVASVAIMELLIKSYGLQCSSKLAHPRQFMLSGKSPKILFDAAIKQAELLYGASYKNDATKSLVAKQALYLLCGRDKSNKVKLSCQQWRDGLIDSLLAEKPKTSKKPAANKAA